MFIEKNIVQWEKSWLSISKIFLKKEKINSDLWIYNKDVYNIIKKFVKT